MNGRGTEERESGNDLLDESRGCCLRGEKLRSLNAVQTSIDEGYYV